MKILEADQRRIGPVARSLSTVARDQTADEELALVEPVDPAHRKSKHQRSVNRAGGHTASACSLLWRARGVGVPRRLPLARFRQR
ncbi:hypothetical protein EYF80_049413 [Liparis tanakae]|uniref:Uncharacterized protein n=1 Tax=Liparis tanakae TaxID=230148 RepID=A0A4Z2FGV1_9TELE|nr:hypothetical protein EYF80_049413 [Liparis tanakae]